jgi:hypothetical protein
MLRFRRRVQRQQYAPDPCGILNAEAARIMSVEEGLKRLVAESPYHRLRMILSNATVKHHLTVPALVQVGDSNKALTMDSDPA